jgi:hypothetical protein
MSAEHRSLITLPQAHHEYLLMAHYPFQPDNNNEGALRNKYPLYKAQVTSAELAVTYVAGFPISP